MSFLARHAYNWRTKITDNQQQRRICRKKIIDEQITAIWPGWEYKNKLLITGLQGSLEILSNPLDTKHMLSAAKKKDELKRKADNMINSFCSENIDLNDVVRLMCGMYNAAFKCPSIFHAFGDKRSNWATRRTLSIATGMENARDIIRESLIDAYNIWIFETNKNMTMTNRLGEDLLDLIERNLNICKAATDATDANFNFNTGYLYFITVFLYSLGTALWICLCRDRGNTLDNILNIKNIFTLFLNNMTTILMEDDLRNYYSPMSFYNNAGYIKIKNNGPTPNFKLYKVLNHFFNLFNGFRYNSRYRTREYRKKWIEELNYINRELPPVKRSKSFKSYYNHLNVRKPLRRLSLHEKPSSVNTGRQRIQPLRHIEYLEPDSEGDIFFEARSGSFHGGSSHAFPPPPSFSSREENKIGHVVDNSLSSSLSNKSSCNSKIIHNSIDSECWWDNYEEEKVQPKSKFKQLYHLSSSDEFCVSDLGVFSSKSSFQSNVTEISLYNKVISAIEEYKKKEKAMKVTWAPKTWNPVKWQWVHHHGSTGLRRADVLEIIVNTFNSESYTNATNLPSLNVFISAYINRTIAVSLIPSFLQNQTMRRNLNFLSITNKQQVVNLLNGGNNNPSSLRQQIVNYLQKKG